MAKDLGGARRNAAGAQGRLFWRSASEGLVLVASGGAAYDRARTLPRLIAIDPAALSAGGPMLDRRIVARLTRALREERRRGRAGHWTYDLNRHLALMQALAAETGRAPGGGFERRPRQDIA